MTNSCKKIFFIAVLFTLILGCTIFSTPFSAYADDSIPPDLGLDNSDFISYNSISADDDYILRETSKAIAEQVYSSGDVRATDYTQMIYNYLTTNIAPNQVSIYQLLGGGTSGGSYLNQIKKILYNGSGTPATNRSLYHLVSDIWESCHSATFSASGNGTLLGYSAIIYDAVTTASGDTVANLLSTISANSSSSAYTSSVSSSTLTSILNLLDSYNNITYTDVTSRFSLEGISETFDGTYTLPSSNTTYPSMYLKIHCSATVNTMNGMRIRLPISYPYNQNRIIKVYVIRNNEKIEIPIEYIVSNNTVYILSCPEAFSVADLYFYIDSDPSPANVTYSPASSVSLKVEIASDNLAQKEYYADLAIMDINHKLSALEIIKNEIASPDLVQAKEESSPTTKQALDDFTGDGSSAATPSHVSSASDISDSVSSGVDAGGAVSDALTVFNPAADFFGWFSQDCANYFIPYQTSRGNINDWYDVVWTDDVPDLLTNINNDVQNQIGDK